MYISRWLITNCTYIICMINEGFIPQQHLCCGGMAILWWESEGCIPNLIQWDSKYTFTLNYIFINSRNINYHHNHHHFHFHAHAYKYAISLAKFQRKYCMENTNEILKQNSYKDTEFLSGHIGVEALLIDW